MVALAPHVPLCAPPGEHLAGDEQDGNGEIAGVVEEAPPEEAEDVSGISGRDAVAGGLSEPGMTASDAAALGEPLAQRVGAAVVNDDLRAVAQVAALFPDDGLEAGLIHRAVLRDSRDQLRAKNDRLSQLGVLEGDLMVQEPHESGHAPGEALTRIDRDRSPARHANQGIIKGGRKCRQESHFRQDIAAGEQGEVALSARGEEGIDCDRLAAAFGFGDEVDARIPLRELVDNGVCPILTRSGDDDDFRDTKRVATLGGNALEERSDGPLLIAGDNARADPHQPIKRFLATRVSDRPDISMFV